MSAYDPKRHLQTTDLNNRKVLPVIGIAIRSVRIREIDPRAKRIG